MAGTTKAFAVYGRRKGGRGELMWFDGKKLTNNQRARLYGSKSRAKAAAWQLLMDYPVLTGYDLYVGAPPRLKNPLSRSDALDIAAAKLEEFSGYPAKKILKIKAPRGGTGLVVGSIKHLSYVTRREGIAGNKPAEYEHTFRESSRPLLAVTTDGKHLHIVGGRYEFTAAGIEDR